VSDQEHHLRTLIEALEHEKEALLDSKEKLLIVLEMVTRYSCYTQKAERNYNGQVAGTDVTDNQAIGANAMALFLLSEHSRFRIVGDTGRMVVGYWPENDPQKKEVKP
jgi:hypothetical protein